MKPTCILLVPAALTATLLTTVPARGADLTPAIVTNLSGSLRIQQGIPCADDVDLTTPVNGGRIELSPSEGAIVGGGRLFLMSRVNVSFQNFSISRHCLGFGEDRDYTSVSVQLARSVSFVATEGTPGVFAVTIPKDAFSIYQAALVNGNAETAYKKPSQDVTGTINLAAGTFSMHVVLTQKIHFEAGCSFLGCVINSDKDGTLTANIAGAIVFPDADADGVPDRSDNCRFVANADQSPVATPSIAAPHAITVHSCLDHGIGIATAADVCDGGPVNVTNDAPAQFDAGANVVTWTARDGKNRTASANQTVTVVDTTKPTFTFVPLDKHVFDCGPVDLGQATAIDDCAGTPTITNDSPGYFYVGTTPVTWKATDASGNFSTAVQNVTVTDLVPPTVACTATNPVGTSFTVTGFDACGPPVLTLGSYVIANGEQIKIEEIGKPGVRLVNMVSKDGLRHFQVGKGQAVILATDGSGNTSTAACNYPK